MKQTYLEYWPQFYTTNIHEWTHLLSRELSTPTIFEQKLLYIHNNPATAGLYNNPEEYFTLQQDFIMKG